MRPVGVGPSVMLIAALLTMPNCSSPEGNENPTIESLRRFEASWDQREKEFAYAHYNEVWGRSSVIQASASPRALPVGAPLPGFTVGTAMSEELEHFVTEQKVAGLLVLHEGQIRLEHYDLGHSPEETWTSHSMGKSMTSTLVGVALQDGFIGSLDDLVTTYLDELQGSSYEGVTVRQLLTMTSGVTWSEDYTDPDSHWARSNRIEPAPGMSRAATYMRTVGREAEPGEKWAYKTSETHLVGDLVRAATGKTLAQYFSESVWAPYGMEADATWMLDASGAELAGCCVQARLRDFARFGQFVVERGRINGTPAVRPDWFDDATRTHVEFDASGRGYGYQWWTWGNGTFSAIGINGQLMYINPALSLVVVISSAWPEAVSDSRGAAQTEFILAVQAAIASESPGGAP